MRVDGAEGSTGSDVPGRMAWVAEGPHGRWPRTLPPKARGAPSDPADTGRGAGGPQKATSHADSRTSTRPGLSAVTSCCLSPPPCRLSRKGAGDGEGRLRDRTFYSRGTEQTRETVETLTSDWTLYLPQPSRRKIGSSQTQIKTPRFLGISELLCASKRVTLL